MMLNEQTKGINLVHGDYNLSYFHLSAALQQPLVHLRFSSIVTGVTFCLDSFGAGINCLYFAHSSCNAVSATLRLKQQICPHEKLIPSPIFLMHLCNRINGLCHRVGHDDRLEDVRHPIPSNTHLFSQSAVVVKEQRR